MTDRPRKGRVATFKADNGTLETRKPSSVTGLRFSVEARSGGSAYLDFTDLRPRTLAIDTAQAIRRLSEVGGPLGARSTILAYANTLRIFFDYLRSEVPELAACPQIGAAHIDGFEGWLEAKEGVQNSVSRG